MVINMKKILFTFLLLIAPMFEAWGAMSGAQTELTDKWGNPIISKCPSADVINQIQWEEFNSTTDVSAEKGCKIYRDLTNCLMVRGELVSTYQYSCSAGCYITKENLTITKCKKCPSGEWLEKHNSSDTCGDIDTTYYHKIDETKYCTASACEDGAEATKIILSGKTYYRCPQGKAKIGDKSVCGCYPGFYLSGTTCKQCPNNGLAVGNTKYPNDNTYPSKDIAFNFADSVKSCYHTIHSVKDYSEDETGTFILSGSEDDRCYY